MSADKTSRGRGPYLPVTRGMAKYTRRRVRGLLDERGMRRPLEDLLVEAYLNGMADAVEALGLDRKQ